MIIHSVQHRGLLRLIEDDNMIVDLYGPVFGQGWADEYVCDLELPPD